MNVVARREDNRLLRGRGRFVDDDIADDLCHMKFVRSPYAHARIVSIDVAEAEALDGVICTLTGAELAARTRPFMQFAEGPAGQIIDRSLANEIVRYQGEPVVAVLAKNAMLAADAAELVKIEYEPLEALVTTEAALASPISVHDKVGTNLIWESVYDWGDVDAAFEAAAYRVTIDRMQYHRFSSTPLEGHGVIAKWVPGDSLEFVTALLQPGLAIQTVSSVLGLRPDQVKIRTRDVGGAFGIKHHVHVYMVACAVMSEKAGGRAVKWIETRSEHLVASIHGSERTFLDTEVALDRDGRILALRSRHIDDCGAYPRYEPLGAVIWSQVASGNYQIRNMQINFQQVCTNRCPASGNRGYSRAQHTWFLERVVDICGRKLGIPADEMRHRNYVSTMPYTSLNGCVYDSGDYSAMLSKASEMIGWDEWQKRIATMRAEGRMIGIGIGSALDSGTNNFGQSKIITKYSPFSGNTEAAHLWVTSDGNVAVAVGSVPQGQSHETVLATVISQELGIEPKHVATDEGFDSNRNAYTPLSGTYASQFAVSTLSAVHGAVDMLRRELLAMAAFHFGGASLALKIGVRDGKPCVISEGDGSFVGFDALWARLYFGANALPQGLDNINLSCRYVFRVPFEQPDLDRKYGNLALTYASQVHIAVLEVDRDTHNIEILDYVAIDDCGKVINHDVVKGQVMGAVAHGLGASLMENMRYDEYGNMLTSTFSDYCPITIVNMPTVKYGNIESPSPFTYNGAKGMGEGGACALHTMSSALQDALGERDVIVNRSHYSPSDLWALLKGDLAQMPEVVVQSNG